MSWKKSEDKIDGDVVCLFVVDDNVDVDVNVDDGNFYIYIDQLWSITQALITIDIEFKKKSSVFSWRENKFLKTKTNI